MPYEAKWQPADQRRVYQCAIETVSNDAHVGRAFSSDGRLLLAIGEPGVPGNDERHFNRPTAIAVLPDGSFYVSDGYRNTRVVKFAANGDFEFQ